MMQSVIKANSKIVNA